MEDRLVTIIGSEGILGRVVYERLASRYRLRRVDVNCPNEPDCQRGDVRSQEDMDRAVVDSDVVVLLAALHGGCNPPPSRETRYQGISRACFAFFRPACAPPPPNTVLAPEPGPSSVAEPISHEPNQ